MSISEHKPMPEPVRRMEVFTGAGRRRSWSAAEKGAIIAESYGAGETVCGVARRHGLTPQQLFTWRRLARQSAVSPLTMFVPAVVDSAGRNRQCLLRGHEQRAADPLALNSRLPGWKFGSERMQDRGASKR